MRVYEAGCCFRLHPTANVWRRSRLFDIGRWAIVCYATHQRDPCSAHWFGEVNGFPQVSCLFRVLSPDAPVVASGGDFRAELAYGNPPNSESHTGAINPKVVDDVVNGHASAFKRLSVTDIHGVSTT